jgi:hypothetical protein
MSSSTVVRGSGALLGGDVCVAIWRILDAELRRRRRDGGLQIRPEVVAALECLRQAGSEYLSRSMSAPGRIVRTSADLVRPSDRDRDNRDLSTARLAELLCVSPRHTRRLAQRHGITPVDGPPYRWSRADVAALLDQRAAAPNPLETR